MLVRFDHSTAHQELLKAFRTALGDEQPDGLFRNPFDYYAPESVAAVDLWLLVTEGKVTASVITKTQTYIVGGTETEVHFLKYPVSLGFVDDNYVHAAAYLLAAIRRQFKLSFLLGMGGMESRTARFFAAGKFSNIDIPFFVKPVNPLGLLAHNPLASRLMRLPHEPARRVDAAVARDGHSMREVDEIAGGSYWKRSAFSLARTAANLNAQAPASIRNFRKFEFRRGVDVIGHVIVFESSPRAHRYFGNLNLWTVLELDVPTDESTMRSLHRLMVKCARRSRVDVLLANASAPEIIRFMRVGKWWQRRSNFCISISPALRDLIRDPGNINLTRLDGDGPINLGGGI